MYAIRDYIEACQFRKNFLSNQRDWLVEERNQFGRDAERLTENLQRIRQEMVGYLIPEVDDIHLANLESRLSYPGLLPIKKQYDTRFDETEKRRAELAAMSEVEFHDVQLEQATAAIEEVRTTYESCRDKVGLWEDSKWFQKLHKRGYFQRGYSAGFLRRFFDWRCVSFLMSHLKRKGGLKFLLPSEMKSQYRALRAEADDVFAAYDKRTGVRDRIVGLKKEHDEILTAPERLLSELYRDLGNAVLEHLRSCPQDLRLDLAKDDRNLNAFLKKEVGVQKQIQYLRELSVTRIDSRIQQIDQELSKLNAKIRKLELQRRRGKRKRYTRSDIDRTRAVKAEKWEKRRQQTRKLRTRIVDFEKYDNGSCAANYLWWDLITKGARGDDLFEVRSFHERHPGWDYKTYHDAAGIDDPVGHDAMDDAAAALASSMASPDDDVFLDAT